MNVTKYLLSPRVRTLFESHTSLLDKFEGSMCKAKTENQLDRKINMLGSDRGGEYK